MRVYVDGAQVQTGRRARGRPDQARRVANNAGAHQRHATRSATRTTRARSRPPKPVQTYGPLVRAHPRLTPEVDGTQVSWTGHRRHQRRRRHVRVTSDRRPDRDLTGPVDVKTVTSAARCDLGYHRPRPSPSPCPTPAPAAARSRQASRDRPGPAAADLGCRSAAAPSATTTPAPRLPACDTGSRSFGAARAPTPRALRARSRPRTSPRAAPDNRPRLGTTAPRPTVNAPRTPALRRPPATTAPRPGRIVGDRLLQHP